ncbi:MAG: single-stranded DNA-binding protein [Alphaproteobacteria bacterium]|nr:single-stranded DNA-binding protein [Alphaproteobacteria bacterium]
MLNRVQLIGNIGQNPELVPTASGDPFAVLSVATSKKWRDKRGEPQQSTQWHSVTIFHPATREFVMKYLEKGMQVLVEAELNYYTTEKNGETLYHTSIVVRSGDHCVRILGSKPKGQEHNDGHHNGHHNGHNDAPEAQQNPAG